MLKRLIFAIIIISAISFGNFSFAQDPEFTQFYANPLYLNPAFAGTARCPRMIMNYRNEWPAISGTFVTYAASYDQHVDGLQGGIGVMILNDRAGEGTLNTTTGSLIYSYRLNVNRNFSIKAGFQAGYIQKKLDWEKLTFGDMIDPRYGFIYETKETQVNNSMGNLDLSAGILGFSKEFFGGIAVHHLTQPKEGFIVTGAAKLPVKITIHGGAIFPLDETGEESNISPNILFQKQQDFQQLNIGIYMNKGPIVGGLWYRQAQKNSDAFIVLIGFQQGMIKFGYSYDITLSKLSNASAGSHEFSFALQFDCRPKKRKFRTISCPSF
ncbi:MAG: type IX secretion system membrane protein PorP/SprF [Bacteroidota bacterium]